MEVGNGRVNFNFSVAKTAMQCGLFPDIISSDATPATYHKDRTMGYLFVKLDLPAPPIILGMLLEATGESGFKNAILMSKGEPVLMYYLHRPASLILMVLIFISVGLPAVKSLAGVIKKKRAKA